MKTIKLICKYMKKNIFLFLLTITMLIFLNYLRTLIPLFISKTISIVGNTESTSTLPQIIQNIYPKQGSLSTLLLVTALLIAATAIARDVTNLFVDVNITKVAERIGVTLQNDYYNKVQDLPYSYLNHAETGDLIQRSTQDIYRFKRFVSGSLPQMFNALSVVVITGIQMYFISPKFTLINYLIVPIYFCVSFFYFRHVQKDFTRMEQSEGKMTTVLQENLTGIRVVKAFANEKYEINKFKNSIDEYTRHWDKANKKMSIFWGSSDCLTYIQSLLSFGLGIYFILFEDMPIDHACALIIFTQNVAWPARALARQISEFGKTSICAGRINEILELKTEYSPVKLKTPKIEGNIKFENMSFNFPDSQIPILKNINLEIKAGETIAIIGKTGCGKSTFVNLLNRLIDPTDGKIYIDGVDLTTIDKKYIRKHVGVILQEPFLFSKTIAENIAITTQNYSEGDVKRLAAIANVDDDIERFDNKYKTMVGERGVTLSGGQKQRIAIARMLADEHEILIFDDSLSAVDTETDLKIRNALEQTDKKCTKIIITHRITTAKDADRILIFENGSITEIGTHEELIQREGLYKKIWNIQNYFNDKEGDVNV